MREYKSRKGVLRSYLNKDRPTILKKKKKKDRYLKIPVNLSIAVEIFKPFEYFSKYRGYGSFVEYSMLAIGSPSLMFDNIQQGSTF